jgi:hypothetical protein
LAGFAKSTPSQVRLGTGVGAKTGPKFAKVFGYRSFDELKSAAWEWWKAQGNAGQEAIALPKTAAMQTALDAILSLQHGTREQIEAIFLAYGHPRFASRDSDWWLQTLLAELAHDRFVNIVNVPQPTEKKKKSFAPEPPTSTGVRRKRAG